MEKSRIQELILKYNRQAANVDEVKEIEKLVESGQIDLEDLTPLTQMQDRVTGVTFPSPSPELDDRFYQMMALEKSSQRRFSWKTFFSRTEWVPKLAMAAAMLIIGISIGYLVKPAGQPDNEQLATLNEQVVELKEMMMLSLLEKESATDRLKAVSLTSDMDEASSKVTNALLQTLNQDENVNVRLAALDALKPYVRDSQVREALIRSISKQNSPLVQVALADLMAQLQAKSSVDELKKIMESENTPADIKDRIKQNIDILI